MRIAVREVMMEMCCGLGDVFVMVDCWFCARWRWEGLGLCLGRHGGALVIWEGYGVNIGLFWWWSVDELD